MIQLLQQRQRALVKDRDKLLFEVEVKYMHYIHALSQQKLMITDKIRRQYDTWIKDNNDMIYGKLNQQFMTLNHSSQTFMNDICNFIIHSNEASVVPTQIVGINPISEGQTQQTQTLQTQKDTKTIKTESNNANPFIPHMCIEEVQNLGINDRIDHRDLVGCFTEAVIVAKQGTNLRIHYCDWDSEWDIWSDFQTELYRFAKHRSVTHRHRHRLFELKIGDFVDICPRTINNHHSKGWKIGEIMESDEFGQAKICYTLNEGLEYYHWCHLDNGSEIEAVHTHTHKGIANKNQFVFQSASFHCLFCAATFESNAHLRGHILKSHSSNDHKRKHICEFCPQAFVGKINVSIHQKQHLQNESFKCTLCPKLFECQTSFKLRGHLRGHWRRVHRIEIVGINNQKKKGKSKSSSPYVQPILGHKRKHCNNKSVPKKRRKVSEFETFVAFEDSYIVSIHCHICRKHFENIDVYCAHLKAHYLSDSNRTWFHCDLGCAIDANHPNKTAKYTGIHPNKQGFISHIATHTNERAFQCVICDSCTASKGQHSMHWKRKHLLSMKQNRELCESDSDSNGLLPLENAQKMSVSELREAMRKRGFDFTGHKKTLLQRLEANEKTKQTL